MATRLLHALLFSAGIVAGSALAADASYAVDLPSGTLAASVETLARQAGLQILVDQRLLDGRQSSGIKGRMTAREALDRLLAGSGLSAVATGDRAYALRTSERGEPGAAERRLGEIVVAATRTANPIDKVPASVSVATREDFDDTQATDVAQVMRKMPNVEFGGGPRVDGEIPSIRGYSGKAVTLLVDGARQNWLNNTLRNPLYLDPHFISTVEVVRGSASSLYGPGGLGGAMAFRTISAADFLSPEQSFGAGVSLGHASADHSYHVNARAYGQNDVFDGLVAIGEHNWGPSIRQGGGTDLTPNDGGARNALLKLGATADKVRYELAHQEFRRDNRENSNPQADSALAGAPAVQLFHTNQEQTVVKAVTTERFGGPQLSATLYDTELAITADRGANAATAPYTMMRTNTVGAGVQGSMNIGDAALRQRLTAGIDYYEDKQKTISGTAPSTVAPDGEQDVSGVFVQDELVLGGAWALTPSVRYDRYETTPVRAGASASASHTSPKIALAWHASDAWMTYASYGQAFRAPNVNEMYWFFSGTSAFSNFRQNPDLKPETDTTFELGTKYSRRGLLAENDRVRLRAAFFDSKVKDMILSVTVGRYTPTGPFTGNPNAGNIFQYQNVADAKRRGGEIEAGYALGDFEGNAAYSRVRVTDQRNGDYLFAPPDKLVLRLRYAVPAAHMSIHWVTTGVAAQDYDSTLARRRQGYSIHDLFASWEVQPGGKKLRLDVGFSNLSDKQYLVYQSSNAAALTYQEGKSVKIALSAEF